MSCDNAAVQGFAIAGEDRKWHWAEAKIVKPNQVEVSSKDVKEPVAVRYAWADNPVCNLYSTSLLPVTPFRTDDWPGVTAESVAVGSAEPRPSSVLLEVRPTSCRFGSRHLLWLATWARSQS